MNTAVAKRFVEVYTGYLIDTVDMVDTYVDELPHWLPWAPLYTAPTITDIDNDTTLVDTDDFRWTTDGRIIDLAAWREDVVWQIEYTPGYDGFTPASDPDATAHYAPAWMEQIVEQLEGIELEVLPLEEEELGDYKYRRGGGALGSALAAKYPSLVLMLDLETRLVV